MGILSTSEAIGERIKELRKKNGESQEALATALKCNQNNISKMESGMSLTIENLISIAKHYHVSMDYLCNGEGGVDLLDTLTKYIKFSYSRTNDITSPDDETMSVPKLQVNKSLFDYIVQIEKARTDTNIPADLKEKWISIELEKFNSRLQNEEYTDYISIVPIPEEIAYKHPETLLLVSTKNKF